MDDLEIRAALERHWTNIADPDIAHEIYHDDLILEFPQGGEKIVGLASVRAMREVYPAGVAFALRRVRGGGAIWVAECVLSYDGGTPSHGVQILEFRGAKVARETIYWGEPWEPPAWRARWVESME